MTFRVVSSVLGKRRLLDLYDGAQVLVCGAPAPPIHTKCYVRRRLSIAATHVRSNEYLAPPTPSNSARRHASSSAGANRDSASPPDPKSKLSKSASGRSTASESRSTDVADWEENPDLSISTFSDLPERNLGVNQHMVINNEFKDALRQIVWRFKAPIRYAVAYGSGVFTQQGRKPPASSSKTKLHPNPPQAIVKAQDGGQKMIDFIFGVSYSQHWHSLNLQEHRDHYSAVRYLGSYAISKIQDSFGAGLYFNPYVTVNGTLIKYGVVNLDTLCRDLSQWDTLYLAGRLQKPVKILRDNPSVRLANQVNLTSAVRTALLLLPPDFTEQELYSAIAGISYLGDPRMSLRAEDPRKVLNIVQSQLPNFRRLYAPIIKNLPNISFNDSACSSEDWADDSNVNAKLAQDMDPVKRGNMVRRLPKKFREKLYFEYQGKFGIPRGEFNKMLEEAKDDDDGQGFKKPHGGIFEQRIAKDVNGIGTEVRQVIEKTIRWPSLMQTVKAVLTAGITRSWRYAREKRGKHMAHEANQWGGAAGESGSKNGKVKNGL